MAFWRCCCGTEVLDGPRLAPYSGGLGSDEREGGTDMLRFCAVVLLCLSCAACANDGSFGSQAGRMHLIGPAAAAEPADAGHKTLASKVMSAIALEKVTGRKPDPERLMQLD